ncbi:MAG TPA: UvrD-helicase domain-containing protein [Bacteroidales bacterium]|nr:UvrD-helicase domain-containing protein [Bacteroidales bacterium]
MSEGTLTVYNASAGSGKTYTLTGIYLSALFRNRYNYRKILAVTFTNKATAEMKSRILESLYKLSKGEKSEFLSSLVDENHSEEWIRKESGEILNCILHDYSRFSVSTIDSFFQKVIRAFAREAGLHSGFSVELEHELLLSAAVDEMISSASKDEQLAKWLSSFATHNIDEEKTWDLRYASIKLARELFSEKFKILSQDEITKLSDKGFLTSYIEKLKNLKDDFEKRLKDCGKKAVKLFDEHQLKDEMFFQKGRGIPRYIRMLSQGNIIDPNCYAREVLSDNPRWSSGPVPAPLQSAIAAGLGDILRDSITYYDQNKVAYNTADVILTNIYALGILTDILHQIHIITNSVNTFLLSDAGEFLYRITGKDQCPFIYEKIGNRYENYMIDEFQDTSIIQWNNFKPLIENSMSQGYDNLVVGDIKQSIYRWRNSDWTILNNLPVHNPGKRFLSKSLNTNWRSAENIISFNNSLFSSIPVILDEQFAEDLLPVSFSNLYSEAIQNDPGRTKGGYVRFEFYDDDDNEDDGPKTWKDKVLEKLPDLINSLLDKGYSASDIGIIVRESREGSMVLKHLIENTGRSSDYSVVSDDSLLLSGSPAINFIISTLSVIADPADSISAACMLRFYLAARDQKDFDNIIPGSKAFNSFFPEDYSGFLASLENIPLFETTEKITGFFGLGDFAWNVPYLSAFHDVVLQCTSNGNTTINSFLEWWFTSGYKKSVVLPGNQDAVRILTIHKSKGLEFRIVIVPFISWNLDHSQLHQPLIWAKPEVAPFKELGVVPVKCSKDLKDTIFASYYGEEKYSVYLDNLNLLYVAFTRAKEVLLGFAEKKMRPGCISGLLKEALIKENVNQEIQLKKYNNPEENIFEFGELPGVQRTCKEETGMITDKYPVKRLPGSLRLKLHGENYFSPGAEEIRKRISYGKIMHEVFENINTVDDINASVRKLVLEGKLPETESQAVIEKITNLLNDSRVKEWFAPGANAMRESGIILTSGNIRRPDRVILKDGNAIIIDFKFGEEKEDHIKQIELYRSLLIDMGYENTTAYVWYVDKNKVVNPDAQ